MVLAVIINNNSLYGPAVYSLMCVISISNDLNWSLLVLVEIEERLYDHVLEKQLISLTRTKTPKKTNIIHNMCSIF